MAYGHFVVLGSACALSLILYTIGGIIYNLFFHPLRSFPGPTIWAATRIPLGRSWISGRHHHNLLELHDKYGDTVRTGPDEISYTNAQAWRDVYAHRKAGLDEFAKETLSMPPTVNGVEPIVSANRENHARFRRLLSHAFSDKGLREQEPLLLQHVDLLIARLHESDGPQDMAKWYSWTTFDLIGDLAFGESFHCLETTSTHPWIGFIFGSVKAIPYITLLCRYGLFSLLLPLLPKKLLDARREHYEFGKEKVMRRIGLGKERGDLLDHVLKHDDDGNGMTLEELVSNAQLLVLAGSETTSTLLAGATYYLLQEPNARVMEKLLAEIRGAFVTDADITIVAVAQLKYLGAVLEEALRIYPPVPLGQQRVVPAPGDTVMGKWLPGGTVITVQHYASYHSASNFHLPESFIPERFLDDNDDASSPFAHDNRDALQPFAIGPRNCIGRTLAMMEMRLILAKLLFHFNLALVDDNNSDDDGPSASWAPDDQRVFLLWEKEKPLWVRLTPVTLD